MCVSDEGEGGPVAFLCFHCHAEKRFAAGYRRPDINENEFYTESILRAEKFARRSRALEGLTSKAGSVLEPW